MEDRRFLHVLQTDPAIRESLLVSAAVCLLGLGIPLFLSWLWVLAIGVGARRRIARGPILVCGHRLKEGRLSKDYRQRLDSAAGLLAAAGPDAQIWLLGGGHPSEAEMGQEYLVRHHDVDLDHIFLEEASSQSFENLRNARLMLAQRKPPPVVTIVSNRYHLARLRTYARELGLAYRLHPVERLASYPRHIVRSLVEAAYLCWFTTGRLYARMAGRDRLLARIR